MMHTKDTNLLTCSDSSTDTKIQTSHVSCGMCHESPVTCHLTTTVCSFSCYASTIMLGDGAEGSLVIGKVFFLDSFEILF